MRARDDAEASATTDARAHHVCQPSRKNSVVRRGLQLVAEGLTDSQGQGTEPNAFPAFTFLITLQTQSPCNSFIIQ